jgi:type III pantothenate kinase
MIEPWVILVRRVTLALMQGGFADHDSDMRGKTNPEVQILTKLVNPVTLLIDLGNTRIKWRRAGSVEVNISPANDLSALRSFLQTAPGSTPRAFVSSVALDSQKQSLLALLDEFSVQTLCCRAGTEFAGLRSGYREPSTLGADRWLAMVALWVRRGRHFLLVDAGSAITLDLVDDQGCHSGGYILPGIDMQLDALARKNPRLEARPLTPETAPSTLMPGRNTKEAVSRGVLVAMASFITSLLEHHGLEGDDLCLTGGDAGLLHALCPQARVMEHLVLEGLEQLAFISPLPEFVLAEVSP